MNKKTDVEEIKNLDAPMTIIGFMVGHSLSGALFEASIERGDIVVVFPTAKEFIEKQAELEHKQWQHWTKYFLENYKDKKKIEQWKKEVKVSYSQLSEKQKESDREWAKKTFEVLRSIYEEFVESKSKNQKITDKLLEGMFGKPVLFLIKYSKIKKTKENEADKNV